ncbi:SIS domain-containing protein [Novosphingobium sp.]|uniref:KpsF/GutQ family sugar-phosphate isomerase n=1 Tax=Novosphingobium sp. TaxID=1874826 RepID=UPI00345C4BCC
MEQFDLANALDKAIVALAASRGRVVVTGMGKSGHIARKIAATMRSTGTPALYLHPGEASHGDLGLITKDDIVLAITWSGETAELTDIIYFCRRYKVQLIVATAHCNSTIGRAADICLLLPHVSEACPNELAPTSSTTVQLAIGDALAVALIEARGFTSSDFHVFHPGGKLGSQLVTIEEIMGVDDSIPRIYSDSTLMAATIEMSRKRYGCTAIVDQNERLVGAFTDGDLRRCIAVHDLTDKINLHMSPHPLSIGPDTLATDALKIMNENAVSVLFVESFGKLTGIVHMHDILRNGVA